MIFNRSTEQWEKQKASFTSTEIWQQPNTWQKTLKQMKENKTQYQAFIDNVLKAEDFDIVLCGAGTSEFVGNSAYVYLNKQFNYKVKSYGTTDLVVAPQYYLSSTKPTILVSFGRSGNSPESVGAIEAANAVCENVYHVLITCNKNGALAKNAANKSNCLAINLTDETHDQSFAMTSSFSNMLLSVLCLFNLDKLAEIEKVMNNIISGTNKLVNEDFAEIENVVDTYDFKRIVYLGSNCLKGISQESALKMLELTAGDINTLFDTPTGFRHGPKSIVNDETLCVIYLSGDEFANKYEIDLIKEMASQRKANKIMVVSAFANEEAQRLADYYYCFNLSEPVDNGFLGLPYIVVAQMIALYKSMSMNITPDNPCPSGEVNRVVKGVNIYPIEK